MTYEIYLQKCFQYWGSDYVGADDMTKLLLKDCIVYDPELKQTVRIVIKFLLK